MGNPGKKPADDDEVEQLLRAAQEDMLLNLTVNSHMARGASAAAVDPDLDRRFQALKKPTKIDDSTKSAPTKPDTGDHKVAGDDDLFARFAALKNSLPSYGGNGNKSNFVSDESAKQMAEDDNDEDDEVEKVIKWAIDAARLDPSPPSEDDDDDDHNDDDEDEDDDRVKRGKNGRRK